MRIRATILALAAAVAAGPAHAEAAGERPAEMVLADAGPAARLLPLDEVLAQLTRDFGLSFIFDSALAKRTLIRSPAQNLPPNVGLDAELKRANLSLYTVKQNTYAIAAARAAPASLGPAVVSPAIVAPDRIIVAASASAALAASLDRLEISAERLALIGVMNPAEAIFELPQSVASFAPANTVALGSAGGISLADLRGMGHQRTLILVDGRRKAPTPGGNGPIGGIDLGSIPAAFVEKIEIHAHARSAQLGEEAVAGAVNFALRKNVRGVEAGFVGGVSQRGDAAEFTLYALAGGKLSQTLEITAGLAYAHEDGLSGAARKETSESVGFALDGRATSAGVGALQAGFGGSSIIPDGLVTPARIDNGEVSFLPTPENRGYRLDGAGGFAPYSGGPESFYNFAPLTDALPPAERYFWMSRLKWTPTDRISAFLDVNVSNSSNNIAMAPVAGTIFSGGAPMIGDGAAIDIDSPSIPDGLRAFVIDAYGGAADALLVSRRYVEVGPRRQQIRRVAADMIAGVTIDVSDETDIEISYRFGRVGVRALDLNRIDRDRLDVALDAPRCGDTPGCEPIDFFRRGGISPAAADFIRAAPEKRRIAAAEHEFAAILTTHTPPLLPDGARLRAGALFRRTHLADATDRQGRILGAFAAPAVDTRLQRAEAFFGAEAPAALGPLGEASIGFGLRTGLQSGDIATINYDANIEWSPASGLTFVIQNQRGGRAPNIFEAGNIGQTAYAFLADPCINSKSDPIVAANCSSVGPLGVPENFEPSLGVAGQTYYGNPDAAPERVRAWSVGARVSPDEVIGLPQVAISLGAIWRRYRIEDYLASSRSPLSDCYGSADLSDAACGLNPATGLPAIRRRPETGRLIGVDFVLYNNGRLIWEGADFDVRFVSRRGGLPFVDRAWLTATHTLTAKVLLETSADIRLDGLTLYPRNRTWMNAGVARGPFEVAASAARRGRAMTGRDDIPEARLPAVTTIDLSARWSPVDAVSVAASVENLTDRAAPVVALGRLGAVLPEHYDIIGRRFTLAVEARF